jgi:hypothetical protein
MDPSAATFVPAVDSPSSMPAGTNQPAQSTPGSSDTSSIVHVAAITPGTPANTEAIATETTDMPASNVTERIERAHTPAPTAPAPHESPQQRTNNTNLTSLQTVARSSNLLATASHPVQRAPFTTPTPSVPITPTAAVAGGFITSPRLRTLPPLDLAKSARDALNLIDYHLTTGPLREHFDAFLQAMRVHDILDLLQVGQSSYRKFREAIDSSKFDTIGNLLIELRLLTTCLLDGRIATFIEEHDSVEQAWTAFFTDADAIGRQLDRAHVVGYKREYERFILVSRGGNDEKSVSSKSSKSSRASIPSTSDGATINKLDDRLTSQQGIETHFPIGNTVAQVR